MGDKKSEYEEALKELDDGEQALAYIEGSREDEGTVGVLIATDRRLFWFDKLVFGMKTKKSYEYEHYIGVKVEIGHGENEIEFTPRPKGFMGMGSKDELEIEHLKSPEDQVRQFAEVVSAKIAEFAPKD
jgi:hypothetical protein